MQGAGEGVVLVQAASEGVVLVQGAGDGIVLVQCAGEGAVLMQVAGKVAILVEGAGEGVVLSCKVESLIPLGRTVINLIQTFIWGRKLVLLGKFGRSWLRVKNIGFRKIGRKCWFRGFDFTMNRCWVEQVLGSTLSGYISPPGTADS